MKIIVPSQFNATMRARNDLVGTANIMDVDILIYSPIVALGGHNMSLERLGTIWRGIDRRYK